jgi:hypothetical protein
MTPSQKATLKEHIIGLVQFFEQEGYSLKPYPKVVFKEDNGVEGITEPTGNYQPGTNTLNLYCNGRHIKDVLNTASHELWHKHQDVQGKLSPEKLGESENYTDGNDYLKEIEHEAFKMGNVLRRKYTESLKN